MDLNVRYYDGISVRISLFSAETLSSVLPTDGGPFIYFVSEGE